MSIYKITQDNIVEPKGQSYMDSGIHENVELVDVVCEVSKNGNPFIAFYFENERGERASKTEWEVNNKPADSATPDEKAAFIKKVTNQMSRIATIAGNFISKDELLFEAPDFVTFTNIIKNKLDGKTTGTKLRIKIIYDHNDWATLPSYLAYPWIEKMEDFPTDKSKIKVLTGLDKMTKSTPDDTKKEANPLADLATSSKPTDDLPF